MGCVADSRSVPSACAVGGTLPPEIDGSAGNRSGSEGPAWEILELGTFKAIEPPASDEVAMPASLGVGSAGGASATVPLSATMVDGEALPDAAGAALSDGSTCAVDSTGPGEAATSGCSGNVVTDGCGSAGDDPKGSATWRTAEGSDVPLGVAGPGLGRQHGGRHTIGVSGWTVAAQRICPAPIRKSTRLDRARTVGIGNRRGSIRRIGGRRGGVGGIRSLGLCAQTTLGLSDRDQPQSHDCRQRRGPDENTFHGSVTPPSETKSSLPNRGSSAARYARSLEEEPARNAVAPDGTSVLPRIGWLVPN